MKRVEVPSYPVSIFIAGSAADIEDQCRTYADEVGFCVTCTPTTFIYTGGEEDGYIIGLINYPRFPSTPDAIWAHAEALAERLRVEASQESYTIQAPDKTVWFSRREQDQLGGHVMSYEAWGDDGVEEYDHLIDAGWWTSEQAEEMVEAIKALFAEQIYEDGEMGKGVSVRFLMRMQMLKAAACMAEPNDPFVAEARAYFAAHKDQPA